MVKLNNVARSFKVVLLGSGGVGKSSLLNRYLGNQFRYDYEPTLQDCYRHTITLPDGATCTLEIVDTAGEYQFPAMRALSIRTAEALIIVFSIKDRSTFLEACQSYHDLVQYRDCDQVPLLLVGNKCDQFDDRQVSWEEASHFAKYVACCEYEETSALKDINVDSIFQRLYQQLVEDESNVSGTSNKTLPRPRSFTLPESVMKSRREVAVSTSVPGDKAKRSNSTSVRPKFSLQPSDEVESCESDQMRKLDKRRTSASSRSSMSALRDKLQRRRQRTDSVTSRGTSGSTGSVSECETTPPYGSGTNWLSPSDSVIERKDIIETSLSIRPVKNNGKNNEIPKNSGSMNGPRKESCIII